MIQKALLILSILLLIVGYSPIDARNGGHRGHDRGHHGVQRGGGGHGGGHHRGRISRHGGRHHADRRSDRHARGHPRHRGRHRGHHSSYYGGRHYPYSSYYYRKRFYGGYHHYYDAYPPYPYDYYSGYSQVGSGIIVAVEEGEKAVVIRLNNGMRFRIAGSVPGIRVDERVSVFRRPRGQVGYSFGVGGGPFSFYVQDHRGRDYQYYLSVNNALFLVERIN